jgi:aspartate/methionine/tyrosine aminotransferase
MRTPKQTLASRVTGLGDEGAYAILEKANRIDSSVTETVQKVVHLEIGQPSATPPAHVTEALIDAVRRSQTKYTDPAGLPELREAICRYTERCHKLPTGSLSSDMVVVGPGAKPGITLTCLALLEPGDEALIPDPGFPTYRAAVELCGARAVTYSVSNGPYMIDADQISQKITNRTKILILNSPSNPTGGVISYQIMEELKRVLKLHGRHVWILSDEIYSRLYYSNESEVGGQMLPASVFSDEELRTRTILIDGLSKSFSMTGFRIGYAIAPTRLTERLRVLAVHMHGCVAQFTQKAAVAALAEHEKSDAYIEQIMQQYQRNRDITYKSLSCLEGCKLEMPQGAFYAWLDVSSFKRPVNDIVIDMMQLDRVAVLPGTDFGARGEGFLRISFVCDESTLCEGIQRITNFLQRLRKS